MSNYDTQKIRLNLQAELNKAEKALAQKPTIETSHLVRWLKSKLEFYTSEHYPEYKKQNGEMQ